MSKLEMSENIIDNSIAVLHIKGRIDPHTVEQFGKLYMNNSIVYNIGYLDKGQESGSGRSGVYVSGSGSIIRGNLIQGTTNSYYGIVVSGT